MTQFNKKSLALAVSAAVLGFGFSGSATAAFVIGGDVDTIKYANESILDDSAAALLSNDTTFPLDLQTNLGARVVGGLPYYIRFEFDGAQFANDPAMRARNIRISAPGGVDATEALCAEVTYEVVSPASGVNDTALCDSAELNSVTGGLGKSLAVFNLKAGTSTAGERKTTDEVYLLLNQLGTADNSLANGTGNKPLKITSKNGVTVKYGLYDKPAQALEGGVNGLVASAEEKLLDFTEPSFQFVADRSVVASGGDESLTTPSVKIDVATESTKFSDSSTIVELGRLSVRDSCGLDEPRGDYVAACSAENIYLMTGVDVSTTAGIIDIFKASGNTLLTVNGDFAAAKTGGKVYYVLQGQDCNAGAQTPATTVTDTSAQWKIGNKALDRVGICMQVNGTTTISGGTYTANLVPEVADVTKYKAEGPYEITLGTLVRNGTILQSPFFNLVEGYVPRFYLTNTGKTDAKFTINLGSDGTLAAGAVKEGVIPANGAILLKGDQIASGGQRGFAEFQVQAPNENIEGVFQFRNATSGDFDSYVMIKK